MYIGQIIGNIDVASLVTAAFVLFFACGLVIYLRAEDRREGYPLEDDLSGKLMPMGAYTMNRPKTFYMTLDRQLVAPNDSRDSRVVKAKPTGPWAGSPLEPTGDALVDGVGPAAWAERANVADPNWDGSPRLVPLSKDSHYWLAPNDPDPRGMTVVAACGTAVGTVSDVWIDRPETMIRYFQVALGDGKTVLVPFTRGKIDGKNRTINVSAIDAKHFALAPTTGSLDRITLREEDRIMGYFSGGVLYTKKACC